jgi:hypothetical protein
MNRQTTKDASVWQSNKCFELFIESPYKSPQSYHTFSKAFTPKCRVANYPKIKVDCKVKPDFIDKGKVVDQHSTTTIQFWLTDIPKGLD